MTRLIMIKSNKKIHAKFYQTVKGSEPVREWLLKLDVEDRKIVGKDIQKVEFGWPIGMPYSPTVRGRAFMKSAVTSRISVLPV